MNMMLGLLRFGVVCGLLIIFGGVPAMARAESGQPDIPVLEDWKGSHHAEGWKHSFLDREPALASTKEGSVPKDCARCHSTAGFHDLLGLDGSAPGTVEKDAIAKNGISCVACHNTATRALESVTFPSGETVEVLTKDVRCMTCHQGRNSTTSVNDTLEAAGLGDDDVSDKLAFIDSHYLPAATRYGTEAKGGYEYDGNEYEEFYIHDEDASRCFDCHSLHTEKIDPAFCGGCHRKVETEEDFRKIRKSKTDFDGDGNTAEGIAYEIRALQKGLYDAIISYATSVAGQGMVYDQKTYPYFFADSNGNGKLDDGEAVAANSYKHWTPRLIKAAYNFQYMVNEPGNFVHNPYYSLQLLYDSMNDLSTKVSVAMEPLSRP